MSISVVCKVCKETFIPLNKKQTSRCGKEHFKACDQCGTEFLITPNMLPTARFCSKACFGLSCRNTTARLCPICNKEVKRVAKTCSTPCATKLRNQTVQAQERTCESCGKEFSALSKYKRFCERDHFIPCAVCGKNFIVNPYNPNKACSAKCYGAIINSPESNEKRKATSRKRWGTEFPQQAPEVKEKIKAKNIELFGYAFPLASPILREKGRKTSVDRYGTEWYTQSEEGKSARAATNLKRYGAENPFAAEEIKKRIKEVWQEKYGVDHPMKNGDVVEGGRATNIKRYGVPNVLMVPEIKARAMETFATHVNEGIFPTSKISLINKAYAKALNDTFNVEVLFEQRFGRFYADLGIADSILVDIHPTVSHNTEVGFQCLLKGCALPCTLHTGLSEDYHFKRALEARAEGKTLIQWYGWENEQALIRLLQSRLGGSFRKYSARKLSLKVITSKEANEFLTLYHIQGGMRGQSHCFGLYASEELVAVATFGKARFKSKAEWEFLRYAVKGGVIIHGGPGRLFSAFVDVVSPKTVVSYVDFNHTTRSSVFLGSLGFVEGAPTGPAVVWHRVTDGKRVRETSLLAIGADRLLGTSYGRPEECGLVNRDIMLLEGFLPVATAGNRVFLWNS
jgi:hypothetical protein